MHIRIIYQLIEIVVDDDSRFLLEVWDGIRFTRLIEIIFANESGCVAIELTVVVRT